MKWISTRGKSSPLSTSEALQRGLAPDGGLFVPEQEPRIEWKESWSGLSYSEFASKVLAPFFAGDVLEKKLPLICRTAFNFPIPLKALSPTTSVLELFHGPTSAFKDFGARFLALALDALPKPEGKSPLVLVATSGDTGGAVAAAFCECTGIPVVILYPEGKISKRQEKQLTSWGPQVRAMAVRSDFDQCQKMVKEAFLSPKWQERFQLISANSINIGRILPQLTYYAYASVQSFAKNKVAPGFIIPSGNLGNGVAALWARRLGFPIEKVVFAHNANQTVPDFFKSGVYSPQATKATLANAMDVGNPSNFERASHFFPDFREFVKVAMARSVSDEDIRQEVIRGEKEFGEIWCPHTATAAFVRREMKSGSWILVATAHPAKFESVIEPLIGREVPLPPKLQEILSKPSQFTALQPRLEDLEKEVF